MGEPHAQRSVTLERERVGEREEDGREGEKGYRGKEKSEEAENRRDHIAAGGIQVEMAGKNEAQRADPFEPLGQVCILRACGLGSVRGMCGVWVGGGLASFSLFLLKYF